MLFLSRTRDMVVKFEDKPETKYKWCYQTTKEGSENNKL